MKTIGYCLSGEMRSLDVWGSHRSNIIDPLNADVFFHTWKRQDNGGSDAPYQDRGDWCPNVNSNLEAVSILNPKSYMIESKEGLVVDYCPEIKSPPTPKELESIRGPVTDCIRSRAMHMFRSLYHSYNVCVARKRYDVLIRSRTDLLVSRCVDIDLDCLEENSIYLPHDTNNVALFHDLFAIGNQESMKHYFCLYPKIKEYMIDGIPLETSIMLQHHLEVSNIKVKFLRFKLFNLHR